MKRILNKIIAIIMILGFPLGVIIAIVYFEENPFLSAINAIKERWNYNGKLE